MGAHDRPHGRRHGREVAVRAGDQGAGRSRSSWTARCIYELDGGDRTKIKSFKVKVEPAAVSVCVPAARPEASRRPLRAFRREERNQLGDVRRGPPCTAAMREERSHACLTPSVRPKPPGAPVKVSSDSARVRGARARRVRRARPRLRDHRRARASARDRGRRQDHEPARRLPYRRAPAVRGVPAHARRDRTRWLLALAAASAPRSATDPKAPTAASTASQRPASGLVYGVLCFLAVEILTGSSGRQRRQREENDRRRPRLARRRLDRRHRGRRDDRRRPLPGLPRRHAERSSRTRRPSEMSPGIQAMDRQDRNDRPSRAHGRLRARRRSS